MRRFTVGLTVVMILTGSQINTALGDPLTSPQTTTINGRVRTVTKNGSVHANIPRIPKFKVLRSNPHRVTHRIIDDVVSDIDDDELITAYRRRDLDKSYDVDEISDEIRWKLFLARQRAVLRHQELHG